MMHHSNNNEPEGANYNINLNLLKVRGSFLSKFKTRNGEDRKCIVLPLDDFIYVDEDNRRAMLGLVAIQRKNDGDDSHFVQIRVDPKTITSEHKPPIIGHLNKMKRDYLNEHDDKEEYITR